MTISETVRNQTIAESCFCLNAMLMMTKRRLWRERQRQMIVRIHYRHHEAATGTRRSHLCR